MRGPDVHRWRNRAAAHERDPSATYSAPLARPLACRARHMACVRSPRRAQRMPGRQSRSWRRSSAGPAARWRRSTRAPPIASVLRSRRCTSSRKNDDRTSIPSPFQKVRASERKTKRNQRRFSGVVRSRGLEPPRVAPLAPQASASTNSATTAEGMNASRRPRVEGARCNKSTPAEQGPRPVRRSWWRAVRGHISADCGGKFRHLSRNAPRRGRPPRDRLSADTVVPRAHSETIASHRDIITWWSARAMM